MLVSILNKSDDAIFWGYELFYSGFKHEFINLIWKIYYDFFATLNPTFETYLLKKHKELFYNENNNHIVSSIIQNLLIKPFTTDIFMQRNLCEQFEIDIEYHNPIDKYEENLYLWIQKEDYRSIARWILCDNKTIALTDIYSLCLDIFSENTKKIKYLKDFELAIQLNISPNVILLSKILQLFTKKKGNKYGKNIYIFVEPEEIIIYENIVSSDYFKSHQILSKAYICAIDDFNMLSLFKSSRNKYNIKEKYWLKWEYHASFSPLWSERIHNFKGFPDYTKNKIVFTDEDLEQEFYELYGLEPDEQPINIQNKSIGEINIINDWKYFYEKFKKKGLFSVFVEELDEFDICKLKY